MQTREWKDSRWLSPAEIEFAFLSLILLMGDYCFFKGSNFRLYFGVPDGLVPAARVRTALSINDSPCHGIRIAPVWHMCLPSERPSRFRRVRHYAGGTRRRIFRRRSFGRQHGGWPPLQGIAPHHDRRLLHSHRRLPRRSDSWSRPRRRHSKFAWPGARGRRELDQWSTRCPASEDFATLWHDASRRSWLDLATQRAGLALVAFVYPSLGSQSPGKIAFLFCSYYIVVMIKQTKKLHNQKVM